MSSLATLTTFTKSYIYPLLPPPVLSLLYNIDTTCSTLLGIDDASILILSTLCSLLGVFFLLRIGINNSAKLSSSGAIGASSVSQRNKSIKRDGVVLVGHSNSGKTVLFHNVLDGVIVNSVTSMSIAEETFTVGSGGKTIILIDHPGHPRLLNSNLPYISQRGKGIILLLDSTKTSTSIPTTAKILHQILTHKPSINGLKKILVLCNKNDLPLSKNCTRVKNMLSLEVLRLERTVTAMGITSVLSKEKGGEEEEDRFISELVGLRREEEEGSNKPFDLETDCRVEIEFFDGCGIKTDGEGVKKVREFIESVA